MTLDFTQEDEMNFGNLISSDGFYSAAFTVPEELAKDFKEKKPVDFVDVPNFLYGFRKQNSNGSDFGNYDIFMNFGKGFIDMKEGYRTNDEVFADGDLQFILTRENIAAGIISLDSFCNGIIANQIQGVKGMKDALAPLKWTRALLNLASRWASLQGIPEMYVLPYERNAYKKVRDDNAKKLIYDVTAMREGFRYENQTGLYVKKLGGKNE